MMRSTMRMGRLTLLGMGLLGLSGCLEGSFSGTGPTLPPAQTSPDSCDRTPVEAYLGESLDFVPEELLREPKRVYPTGSMLTMDYRLERLNVEYDPVTRIILRVNCG